MRRRIGHGGYLVLFRAYPDRVQQRQVIGNAHAGTGRRTRSAAKLLKPEASGSYGSGGGAAFIEGDRAGWDRAVAAVLGLQEEGIFLTIVRRL